MSNKMAFPDPGRAVNSHNARTLDSGMTLRDYFAAAAMGHMLASEIRKDAWANVAAVASGAYKMADAMLAARYK